MSGQVDRMRGYFTMLRYVVDKSSGVLEHDLGYASGTLSSGWRLFTPRFPISAGNIVLRGSTRWPGGILERGNDGTTKSITDTITARSDIVRLQEKVARFFDRGLINRPVKVRAAGAAPKAYPPALPAGIPQFELRYEIEWVNVLNVPSGGEARLHQIVASGFF